MKSTVIRLVVLLSAVPLFAGVTATWTGAQDAYWTNAANWLVEGVVPAKCPGVVSNEVNGVFNPDLPSIDAAVFDGTCTSGRTTIDLSGLYSVASVTICGANCPQYTLGSTTDQLLTFETNGVLTVSAEVPAASGPVVNATVAIGNFEYSWWNKSLVGKIFTVANNSSGTLTFNSQFAVQRRRPGSATNYMEIEIHLKGSGNFRFNAAQSHDGMWLATYRYYQTGTLEINADFCEQKRVYAAASSRVVIAEGATYGTFVGNNVGFEAQNGSTFTVEGDGTFRLVENKGNSIDNHGYHAFPNGYIDVYSRTQCYSSNLSEPRVILYSTSETAKRALRLFGPPGDFPGGFLFRRSPQLVVATTNVLGNCPVFTVTNGTFSAQSGFCWAGTTEGEALTVPINYIGPESSAFAIANIGTQPFTFASAVTVPDGSKTLSLEGTIAPLIFAPTLSGPIALRLSGDIVMPASSSLANVSSINFANGANLAIEGSAARTLPSVAVASGANTIAFADAATLTFSSIAITGGSLDIQVANSGATVVFTGKTSADTPPAGLLLDGLVPSYSDDGRLIVSPSVVDVSIAARGDQVPNASSSIVGITSPGSGEADALAADETSVKALVQQTQTAADIAIGPVQTLSVDEVAIDYGFGDLALGVVAGQGTLDALSSPLVLRNDSYFGTLSVNASITSSDVLKIGEGKVSLFGGTQSAVGSVALAAGETALASGTWNTTSSSKILVTNNAVLSVAGDAKLLSDAGDSSVDKSVATIEILGGTLKIGGNAVITNRITLNHSGNSRVSAVYQSGGTVYEQGDTANNFYPLDQCGGYAQGYWDLTDGMLYFSGKVGIVNTVAQGGIHQSGGIIDSSASAFRLGSGHNNRAEFVMTGGTNSFATLMVRDWGSYNGTKSAMTMDGPSASMTVRGNVQMAYQNGGMPTAFTSAMLNLADGVFCANGALRGGSITVEGWRSKSKAYVNFNGGTFKTRADNGSERGYGLFGWTNDITWIDHVMVYAGGATIETDAAARKVYVNTPLCAPTGKGVASIDFAAYVGKKTGLVAPPSVAIEGDGEGASAYAVFDLESDSRTGIRVVSPGWGYTTATAKLYYGSLYNNQGVECPLTLADSVSGGLTKAGDGTLFLNAANTYTGETVLKGGTLSLVSQGALPAASTVAYEGGALTSKAAAFPASLKVRIPGAENNSVRRCVLATFTDACPAALPEVEVVNAPERARHQWCVEFQGLTLCAKRLSGAVLSFR